MMLRLCCECDETLGVEWPANYEGRTAVSHGYCAPCGKRALEGVDEDPDGGHL